MYKTQIIPFKMDNVKEWVWPEKDEGLFHGPSLDWEELKPAIEKHVKSFNTVVQAGGACGMYPRLLSDMFEKVYTFEPDDYNFYCLSQNCAKPNIFAYRAALGDKNDNITFNPPDVENRGTGQVTYSSTRDKNVPMLQIDNFKFDQLDLLMLDVETFEYYALQGAHHTINKHKPVIFLETVYEQTRMWLQDKGYTGVARVGFDTVFVPTDK